MRKYLWLVVVIAIMAVTITATIFYYHGSRHIVEIGGKPISIQEFQIYLYEQKIDFESRGGEDIWEFSFEGVSLESIAKQGALDALTYVKVAVMQADRMGIRLNDDEKIQAEAEADLYIAKLGDKFDINRDIIINIMYDMLIVDKVYEAVTGSYELSEPDFIAYFDEYIKMSRDEYLEIEIQHIFIEGSDENSQKRIGEARNSIYDGVPFETVVKDYSDNYNKYGGVTTYTEIPSNWDEVVRNAAYALNEGEFSEIIAAKDGYYILYAKKITIPDMDELKEKLRNDYIRRKKMEIYSQEYEKWNKDIVIKKNEKIWNEITIL